MQEFNNYTPLVSIALATYNGEGFLARQLDSLLNQTYTNVEIVVSDDGSTDGTLNILRHYASLHQRMAVYNNIGEKGVTQNFQNAIRKCQGQLIALCDQDDIWLPQKIEKLVNELGECSLIYHDSLLVDDQGNSLEIRAIPNGYTGNDPKVFLLKNVVSGHASLFRRELLDDGLPFPA